MKITSVSQFLILFSFVFAGLSAQNQRLSMPHDSYDIDLEVFSLIKDELETARKALVDIRDSQNPALARQALSSFGGLIKELTYLAGAVALGGSGLFGLFLVTPEWVKEGALAFGGPGVILCAVPPVMITIIVSYTFLKILFGRLLAASEKDAHHIKESLDLIDQTINKLNYEIKKIERLMLQARQAAKA